MIYLFFFLVQSFCFSIFEECQPLIFEVVPDYHTSNNQLESFSKLKLYLSSQNSTVGIFPNRHNFSIDDIIGTSVYDSSKTNISQKDGHIYISGSIDYTFTYNANKSSGITGYYNGSATSSLKGINVSYVKEFGSYYSNVGFFITSFSSTMSENLIPNNDYNPSLSDSDKLQFNNLLGPASDETKLLLKTTLQGELNRIISNNAISNPFGGNIYNYVYRGNTIFVNTSILTFQDLKPGILIGYNGHIGQQSSCSTFKPTSSQKHTLYLSFSFIGQFFQEYLTNNLLWKPLKIDKKSKTAKFQFTIIDLSQIIPSVTNAFTSYKDNIYVNCTPQQNTSTLRFTTQYILSNLTWYCQVNHENTNTNLLNFIASLKYTVNISYSKSLMSTMLSKIEVGNVQLLATQSFPIENSDLANIYIRDIVSVNMVGQPCIGSGFKTPNIQNGAVQISQNFIQVQQK